MLLLAATIAWAPAATLPPSVMSCLEKACPSQIAACQADATCAAGIKCMLACPTGNSSACVDACIKSNFDPAMLTAGLCAKSSGCIKSITANGHANAQNCTGSADQPAPACYAGDIGFGAEHLETQLKAFDAASQTGVLDLIGTGMLEMKCSDKNFTKSGQDILLNVSDCVDPGVTIGEVKYCSDQDVSTLSVTYAGIPLQATLTRETCPPAAVEA